MYEPKRPEIFAAVERSFGYLSGFAQLHDLHMEGSVRKPDLQHLTAKLGAGSYQTLAVADSKILLNQEIVKVNCGQCCVL